MFPHILIFSPTLAFYGFRLALQALFFTTIHKFKESISDPFFMFDNYPGTVVKLGTVLSVLGKASHEIIPGLEMTLIFNGVSYLFFFDLMKQVSSLSLQFLFTEQSKFARYFEGSISELVC